MNLSTLLATGFFAALSLAQTPDAAPAQDRWSSLRNLPADVTVRVQTGSPRPIEGRLAGVTDDALVIRIKPDHLKPDHLKPDVLKPSEQTLPRTSVVSVSVKGKSHRGRHALIGFAVGSGVGLGVGEAYDGSHPCQKGDYCILTAPVGKVILGPAGALIGLAIGAGMPANSWQMVYTR
jgi:hypothetical protein